MPLALTMIQCLAHLDTCSSYHIVLPMLAFIMLLSLVQGCISDVTQPTLEEMADVGVGTPNMADRRASFTPGAIQCLLRRLPFAPQQASPHSVDSVHLAFSLPSPKVCSSSVRVSAGAGDPFCVHVVRRLGRVVGCDVAYVSVPFVTFGGGGGWDRMTAGMVLMRVFVFTSCC